jgi:hypothetical protein
MAPGDAPQLATDGKTAHGSRDGETPGIHLVSVYALDVVRAEVIEGGAITSCR